MEAVLTGTSAPHRYRGDSDSSNTHGFSLSWSDTKTFGVSRNLRYIGHPELHIAMNDAGLDRVMKAYLFPDCVRDVESALESLNRVPLVILSSGSLKILEPAVRHNGLKSSFTDLISVDRARIYKPSPRAYYLAAESLQLPASEISFVSSNSWDGSGAKAYGYTACWCNRQNQEAEFLEGAPDLTGTRLDQIANLIG